MALLRKCLNDLRTRGVPREAFAAVMAQGPDTVIPPPDSWEVQRRSVRAGHRQSMTGDAPARGEGYRVNPALHQGAGVAA